MPPEVLILTSFRQRVVVAVVEQVVAVVVVARQQVVAVEWVVVAVVEQAAVVVERVAAVQQAFAPLQAVPQAFAGKKLPTELCLPLQVAIAFSFCLPPKKFYSYYIVILNGLSSFLVN
jgi:hypothetical protein